MTEEKKKTEIIRWAERLNQRGLVSARSGNLSCKDGRGNLFVTAHDSYLGDLSPQEIVRIDLAGKKIEGGPDPTSESSLHCGIHRRFPEMDAVVHAHSPWTTAFFHYYRTLEIFSFEARFYLGQLPVIAQETPTVTDPEPVLNALDTANIVVLQHHGVVTAGKDFREAASLVELLEEQARVNLMLRRPFADAEKEDSPDREEAVQKKTYPMLSVAHRERLAEIVNGDEEVQRLGRKYGLTCTLAVRNQENGKTMRFQYQRGRIISVDEARDAEFVIIGNEPVLKKVFNRQLDPFVALTQGKVKTKGDFSKMSRWYPVMVRTFQLWEQAPVE
ncbi:MAG: hypothetical protein GF333_02085 [Candidatus Omnitrophica bacterium]|nr:hypothetical protein [Candidatus Omnitrophota bacterium]